MGRIGSPEEEKIIENILDKIMAVNFPNLKKQREKGNTEGPKQGKVKDKEKIPRAAREQQSHI